MKTAKGLGTGLGALFGEAGLDKPAADFEYLPIQRIEPRPEQPRTLFEQERLDELTDSIREHGVLSPLIVRYLDDGYYQIIAGERRWRAARAAGLAEIPARVVVADDKRTLELAMVENLQREDLNPIEEARGFRALMDEFGMTQEQVAQRVSKSRPSVANSLRLLSLPAKLLELVGRGELSAGSARALLALGSNEKMLYAAQIVCDDGMSVREVEKLVKRLAKDNHMQNPDGTPERESDGKSDDFVDYHRIAQEQLTAALGRRVRIKHGHEKGKIEIEYYGDDDFNVIFDALSSING